MFNLIAPNWEIPDIATVIFDKDGTLIDAHRYWGRITEMRSKEIALMFGLPPHCINGLNRAMGWDISTRRLIPQGPVALASRNRVVQVICGFLKERHHINFCIPVIEHIFNDVDKQFKKELLYHVSILPGVYSFLERLHQMGAVMGVLADDSTEVTSEIMSYLGIDEYFDAIVGRENSVFSKESGHPCKTALDMLGADSWHTIVIGDAPVDCQMAKMNGALGVGVATGQTPEEGLKEHTPYTAPDLELFVVGKHNMKNSMPAKGGTR